MNTGIPGTLVVQHHGRPVTLTRMPEVHRRRYRVGDSGYSVTMGVRFFCVYRGEERSPIAIRSSLRGAVKRCMERGV